MGRILGFVAIAGVLLLTIKQMKAVKEQKPPKVKKS